MIDYYYNDVFIRNNELVFYIFIGVMLLIMLITLILVIKEAGGKRVNK